MNEETGLVRVFVLGAKGNVVRGKAMGEIKFKTVKDAMAWCRKSEVVLKIV
jgi:hypothetical protein